jgi:CheY-like chemotaxis protein
VTRCATNLAVLVVDDDPLIRDLIRQVLEDEGCAVQVAEDGVIALERIAERPPDLLVLDMAMPRMNGPEVMRRLAAEKLEIPVIVVSAQMHLDQAVLGFHPVSVVTKPFDLDVLVEAVERVDERHPAAG